MSEEADLLATISSILSNAEASDSDEKITQENKKSEPVNEDAPIDLDMLLKLSGMLSSFGEEDERSTLLRDLKPFLSPEKRDKIDQTIKMLRLLKIAEKAKKENLF